MRGVLVPITIGLTAWTALVGAPSHALQLGMALFAILIGLPHGATDHLAVPRARRHAFRAAYVAGAAAFAALWWMLPPAGLALFVLASTWHFGEADLRETPAHPGWHGWVAGTRGLLVLAVLAVAHGPEVAAWLAPLGGPAAPSADLAWTLAIAALDVHVLAAIMGQPPRAAERTLIDSAVLAAWMWFAPPLFAFAVYFLFWHSLPQVVWQRRERVGQDLATWARAAAPHTAGGLVLAGGATGLLVTQAGLPLVSAGLAALGCLSMPHVAVQAGRHGWAASRTDARVAAQT